MSQTPHQQLMATLNRILRNHDHPEDARDVDVDAILAIITGLPAMQEEERPAEGPKRNGTAQAVRNARNSVRHHILAELEARDE